MELGDIATCSWQKKNENMLTRMLVYYWCYDVTITIETAINVVSVFSINSIYSHKNIKLNNLKHKLNTTDNYDHNMVLISYSVSWNLYCKNLRHRTMTNLPHLSSYKLLAVSKTRRKIQVEEAQMTPMDSTPLKENGDSLQEYIDALYDRGCSMSGKGGEITFNSYWYN